VPQEEQSLYVIKARRLGSSNNYPVGLSPSDIEPFRGGESSSSESKGLRNYAAKAAIPGLNFVEPSTEALPAGGAPKSKSKKGKGAAETASSVSSQWNATTTETLAKSSIPPGGIPTQKAAGAAATAASSQQVDSAERISNLKKRLKEIERLERRILFGQLPSPVKELVWMLYQYNMRMFKLENKF
jgi:hypothetical protein